MAPCRTQQPRLTAGPARRRRGFTLIETALTVTIVGVAIVSLVQFLAAGTVANVDSAELTTGMTLARNVREFSLRLAFMDPTTPSTWGIDSGESAADPTTYDDSNDLAGRTFSPPVDSAGHKLAGFDDWSQATAVATVDPNRLTSAVPNGSTPANRITVTVYHHKQKVCDLTWYVFCGSH
jgi:prepilin-type N-terminal cleavage/methylation domain-containing protein